METLNLKYSRMIETRILSFKETDKLSKRNTNLVLKFVQSAIMEGVGDRRVVKYFGQLKNIEKWLEKDFDKTRKEDIERLVGIIATSKYKEWTKWSYRVMIKKFWKWLEGNNEFYPDKVKWIKSRQKTGKVTLPKDLITREDLEKIIKLCRNDRDRCLFALLYESGVRIGELLGIKIKDINFTSNPVKILIDAEKTKTKRVIPIVESVPYITRWLESHTIKKPDSHLFVNWSKYTGRAMRIGNVYKLTGEINKNLNNGKRIYPHLFRHSRATELANHLTEAQMNKFFGWATGSDMPSVYVHLSGRDIENAILKVYGQEKNTEEKKQQKLSPKICPRCKENALPTDPLCLNCGLPLDQQGMLSYRENREKTTGLIERIIEEKLQERLNGLEIGLK